MRHVLIALSAATLAACALRGRATTESADILDVELTAIRSMLEYDKLVRSSEGWVVVIDPTFARGVIAPGGTTNVQRPRARHDALVKALTADMPRSDDTLRVRASMPVIDDSIATVEVTIMHHRPHEVRRLRRVGFRIDQIVLRRQSGRWVLASRTLLGIS